METKLIKQLDVFTLNELCELLDMSEQTIRKYVRDGRLKASKLKCLYFTKENVLKFINENEYMPGGKDEI